MTEQVLDETLLARLKEDLLQKRGEILAASTGTRPLPASMDVNSRQGDLADQASGNNEVHIQLKLKQTDAKILQAIEEALYRIAPARLEAIPWTRVCIACKQKQNT
jgi:RNA polymerase-binding transcription factor DksA